MYEQLLNEDEPAHVVVVLRNDGNGALATGVRPGDVTCVLHRVPGGFIEKALDDLSWTERPAGIYTLTLDPSDIDSQRVVTVVIAGRPALTPAIKPSIWQCRVCPRPPKPLPDELPRTTLCGRIMTVDMKPRPKVPVTVRVLQQPLAIGGIAVLSEPLTTETDDRGYFQFDAITGANIQVQIPALAFNRQLTVPPAPAVGIPVKLFSI